MSTNSKSWPIALLLCGAAGFGFVAGDSKVVSDASASAVRLIQDGKISFGRQATGCEIKGNIAFDGERVYHLPGQRYYRETIVNRDDGERYFCSELEALQAGWRRSRV